MVWVHNMKSWRVFSILELFPETVLELLRHARAAVVLGSGCVCVCVREPTGPCPPEAQAGNTFDRKHKTRNHRVVCHLGLPTALGVWKEVGGSCRLPQEGFGVLERRVFKVTGPVVIFGGPFPWGKLRGHCGQ